MSTTGEKRFDELQQSFEAEAAVTYSNLLLKRGSASKYLTPSTADTDRVNHVSRSPAAAGDPIAVVPLVPGQILNLVSDGTVDAAEELAPSDAGGKTGFAKKAASGDLVVGFSFAAQSTSGAVCPAQICHQYIKA